MCDSDGGTTTTKLVAQRSQRAQEEVQDIAVRIVVTIM
jgi:hypothetical protein